MAGLLPLADVPHLKAGQGGVTLLRCQLDASTPGPVLLRFNSANGVSLWLDGKLVGAQDVTELTVPAGVHTLTVALDVGARREPLRCELDDKPGSPARVRVVGGK